MRILNLINKNLIITNLTDTTKPTIFNTMATVLYNQGFINNLQGFVNNLNAREEQSSTALENGIMMPHAKSEFVNSPAIVFAKSATAVDVGALDGQPTDLFFMIAMPQNASNEHVEILAELSGLLLDDDFINNLRNAKSVEQILQVFNGNNPASATTNNVASNNVANNNQLILAVTACPTGIAHTYMAEAALQKAANTMGINIKIETNGSSGVKNQLLQQDIEQASAIILATDRNVETTRFNGKPVLQINTKKAINNPVEVLNTALDSQNLPILNTSGIVSNNTNNAVGNNNNNTAQATHGSNAYKHLMTGVSYMLPFVISGGILIALAFLIDKIMGVNAGGNLGSTTMLAKLLMDIGGQAFGLFLPVLAGFIAFSVADRSAITAGFVGGALAKVGGSGFLGAIFAGFVAGYATKLIIKSLVNLPNSLNGIKVILFYPVLTVLLTGVVTILVLNPPVAWLNDNINMFLLSMNTQSKVLLGLLLGGMMAVDMGGPINKAAYVFGTASLSLSGPEGSGIMAAVMAGGMTPPLAIALATTFFKHKFTKLEQESGKSNYIMGLSFITEGAIPFAAADPLRVIPALIVGSATAGALSMVFNITLPAPHGGLVVMFLTNSVVFYGLAIAVGSAISAVLLALLKKPQPTA